MTDITQYSQELEKRMKERLAALNLHEDELATIGAAVSFIHQIISDLKKFIGDYKFADQDEEIMFFKEIKPMFLAQYYYHKRVFSLRLRASFQDMAVSHELYQKALSKLHSYSCRNREFYEYCLSGQKHLDIHYFTRQSSLLDSVDADTTFCTSHDRKLSRILSGELLKTFILFMFQKSEHGNHSSCSDLTWTATKTDLTELIYALQAAEVFNHGNTDIKQIASAFEQVFKVSLGDYYRIFQSIQIRKRGQTNFLDHLRSRLSSRLEGNDD